jgi:hypothetical protein
VRRASADSPWQGQQDLIRDFQKGLDRIDLRAIDANVPTPGNQAFTSIIRAMTPDASSDFAAGTIAWFGNSAGSFIALNTNNTESGQPNNPYDAIEIDDNLTFGLGDFIL